VVMFPKFEILNTPGDPSSTKQLLHEAKPFFLYIRHVNVIFFVYVDPVRLSRK